MSGFIVKNLQQFKADLENADKTRVKAAQNAVKVEGYRLKNHLQEQIRAGAPGGKPFSPLSLIASARRYRADKTPLKRLAIPVRYRVTYSGEGGMTFSFGYVDPAKGKPISKAWKHLALLHQKGGKRPVTDDMRKGLIAIGKRMKKGKQRNVFFLRKATTEINIPARPIIDPFWQQNERAAEQNIIANFARKMRGERI